jgi:hypothetical protein
MDEKKHHRPTPRTSTRPTTATAKQATDSPAKPKKYSMETFRVHLDLCGLFFPSENSNKKENLTIFFGIDWGNGKRVLVTWKRSSVLNGNL